jgi:hypothetical protein
LVNEIPKTGRGSDKESLTTTRAAMEQKYNIPTGDEEAARFVSESAPEKYQAVMLIPVG